MRQLVYTSLLLKITLVSLVVEGKFAQPSESLKYYEHDCSYSETEYYGLIIVFICICQEVFYLIIISKNNILSTIKIFWFVKIWFYRLHIMEVAVESHSGKYLGSDPFKNNYRWFHYLLEATRPQFHWKWVSGGFSPSSNSFSYNFFRISETTIFENICQ